MLNLKFWLDFMQKVTHDFSILRIFLTFHIKISCFLRIYPYNFWCINSILKFDSILDLSQQDLQTLLDDWHIWIKSWGFRALQKSKIYTLNANVRYESTHRLLQNLFGICEQFFSFGLDILKSNIKETSRSVSSARL